MDYFIRFKDWQNEQEYAETGDDAWEKEVADTVEDAIKMFLIELGYNHMTIEDPSQSHVLEVKFGNESLIRQYLARAYVNFNVESKAL